MDTFPATLLVKEDFPNTHTHTHTHTNTHPPPTHINTHAYTYANTCTHTHIPPSPLQLEASQRSCTVKVEYGEHLVRVGISFPSHYPNGAAPSFTFDNSTTIDFTSQQELNKVCVCVCVCGWCAHARTYACMRACACVCTCVHWCVLSLNATIPLY